MECYFCNQIFTVAVKEEDINEEIAFCPFCGQEILDEDTMMPMDGYKGNDQDE